MRIGIDFDNTIACYDGVFHAPRWSAALIPPDLPSDKNSVRDHLNGSGRKDEFTELQGYVYGARMDLVALYPGVLEFFDAAREGGHDALHRQPQDAPPASRRALRPSRLGPRVSPVAMRRRWRHPTPESVFFEETKELKVARVAALDLDVFIDDLPEILAMPGFPARTAPILFDPEGRWTAGVAGPRDVARYDSWSALMAALLARPGPRL